MTWTDERLQTSLASLTATIDWPEGPDLSVRVRHRIGLQPPRTRRWLAIAATAIAVVLFSLTTPGQEAVAWLLRVSGIRIELSDTSGPLEPPTSLLGGADSTLDEAQSAVGFDLRQPSGLGSPDSIQLLRWGGGQQVAMVWNRSDELPEVFETGVGLVLIQFEARIEEELLVKEAPNATRITPVRVNGEVGYFLSGAPHTVYFEDSEGLIADDEIRLTGNVLVWMSDGVTYRIESALGLEETVRIAESVE